MTNIAIIEDEMPIAQMYRIKFEKEGFTVQTASNGQTGVDLVRVAKPDVILLDLYMPQVGGVEALKQIRALPDSVKTPVIVLTNLGIEEAPDEIKKLGVDRFIIKADVTPNEVVIAVKDVLGIT